NLFRKSVAVVGLLGLVAPAVAAPANETSPEILLRDGRADDAIAALQKQLSANQNSAESHNLLCRVYLGLGKLDQAIKDCEAAVQLSPQTSSYHLWLGRA